MNRKYTYLLVTLSTVLVGMLLAGAVLGSGANKSEGQEPYRHLQVFTEVLSKIKSDYVEEPNLPSVTLGAINGLLESVDPYSSYLNSEQYKEFQEKSKNPQADVGLLVARRYGYVGVMSVLPNTAAAKAKLATGDIIDSINNVSTRDMPLAYAELLLQGKPGTAIELTVLRARKPEPETISLARQARQMPKLRQEIVDGSIGYVAPYVLVEGKVKEIQQAVRDLEKKGANRFVLDLRNVALGDTSQGIPLADLFMSKGKITHTEGQRSPKEEFTATAQPGDLSQPLVVLVNRGTAGAAEVAAAALKASGRAKVVGERSYGFAGIRREIQMDDGGAVLISVAKYYAPDGKAIPDTGVIPDEAVSPYPQLAASEEEGELAEPPALGPDDPLKPVEDLQLKKALEVIAGSGAAAKAA